MRTANPALNEKVFRSIPSATGGDVMTLDGTVNKSIFAILLTMGAGAVSWNLPEFGALYLPFIIAGFVLALIISFKQTLAPMLTPVYAVVEGLALGSISLLFESMYPGIVFQAVSLTFGVMFCMLMVYRSGLIKVTDKFRMGVFAATGAVMLVYLVSFIASLFGAPIAFLHSNGLFGIGLSLVIVGIAALNLVLDFDFIASTARQGNMPKYMEWFGAFGLLVTLVWLYIELLRLLMKLQSRD